METTLVLIIQAATVSAKATFPSSSCPSAGRPDHDDRCTCDPIRNIITYILAAARSLQEYRNIGLVGAYDGKFTGTRLRWYLRQFEKCIDSKRRRRPVVHGLFEAAGMLANLINCVRTYSESQTRTVEAGLVFGKEWMESKYLELEKDLDVILEYTKEQGNDIQDSPRWSNLRDTWGLKNLQMVDNHKRDGIEEDELCRMRPVKPWTPL